MDKNSAVLEITSNSLRLVIGYILQDQVYVLYALTNPIPKGIVEKGQIVNFNALVEQIKNITTIKDPSAKLKINISDVILCLPPVNLQVFSASKVTTVVSTDSIVGHIDIRNIHALISKEPVPSTNEIVDIIPEKFILDDERVYTKAPIDEKSNTITMQAKVHTLPAQILETYQKAVTNAGIHVSRVVVSSFGATELVSSNPMIPSEYFLVDVGAQTTTISLIGQNQLFGSTLVNWGSDLITEDIMSQFNVNEADAKKYKELYGYSNKKLKFEPVVCETENVDGVKAKHTLSELNILVRNQLDAFIASYKEGINRLLENYDSCYRTLPAVFVGGGSMLNGLKEYVEPKIDNDHIELFIPKVIGARHPSFTNCIGVLKAAGKYPSVYDDTHPKISSVSRNKQ